MLAKHNIEVSSHPGVRQKFGEHFVKNGAFDKSLAKHFTELFDKRNKGDYNDFFDFDQDTVLKLFPSTLQFIDSIEKLLKNSDI